MAGNQLGWTRCKCTDGFQVVAEGCGVDVFKPGGLVGEQFEVGVNKICGLIEARIRKWKSQ